MIVNIYETPEQVGKAGAMVFAAQVLAKPNSVLGLATGSTPIELYRALIDMNREKLVTFKDCTSFNLDEYVGLGHDHQQSYYHFMHKYLLDHIDIDCERTHVLDGMSEDCDAECVFYEEMIDDLGGIDLQLLGLGQNAHIAFNEPHDHFPWKTHCENLSENTIAANARFFSSTEEVPTRALTMGIGTIMRARRILLLATGNGKAEAVEKLVKGEVTPHYPASILQCHPDIMVMVDKDAAAKL